MRTRALGAMIASALVAAVLLMPTPAQAAARVKISNDQGTAKVDPKYATTVSLNGSGFQSIKGGHGGIYVFFGIKVSGGYLYVPDSETKSNQGFQKFVTFPGNTETGDAANGGELKANGTWSTKLVIPGATFQAVNRSGKKQTVDCLKSTCGIITIGAHGVKNPSNETFTPVSFADLYAGKAPEASATEAPAPTNAGDAATPSIEAPAAADTAAPIATAKAAEAVTAVDPATAVVGRVLSFTGGGFLPGEQVIATLDDGRAAVGPLTAGQSGEIAGVLQIPEGTQAGTHVLRLTGAASGATPTVNFPIAAEKIATSVDDEDAASDWVPFAFLALAIVALLSAVTFATLRFRTIHRRRKTRGTAAPTTGETAHAL